MWKLLSFILILKLIGSLGAPDVDVFDDNTVRQLNHLRIEWLKFMSTIPNTAWITRSLSNPGFLNKNDHRGVSIDLNHLTYNVSNHNNMLDVINNSVDTMHSDIKTSGNKCNYDLIYLLFNLRKSWAEQMLDATGKLPSGLLKGNLLWLGDFKQCRNVTVPLKVIGNFNFGGFKGEYCYFTWTISLQQYHANMPLKFGICVPDSCTEEILRNDAKAVAKILHYIPIVNKLIKYVNSTQITCQTSNIKWESSHVAYMCILSIFAVLMIAGTLCDVVKIYKNKGKIITEDNNSNIANGNSAESFNRYDFNNENAIIVSSEISDSTMYLANDKNSESAIVEFLICFSVYTNFGQIFNTENVKKPLQCIHGFRFISMLWIIAGYVFVEFALISENLLDLLAIAQQQYSLFIIQGTFAVDTFFLIGGFLLSYLFLKRHKGKNKQFHCTRYYLHRIWRLTPTYLMILGFYATVWLHVGMGPFWPKENTQCKNYWWWNLLYIVNFKDLSDTCMGWTWYLANDMQFYIISPIFLLLLWKFSVGGIILICVTLVASMIVTGLLGESGIISIFSAVETLESDLGKLQNDFMNYYNDIYVKPYCRIGPYLVGILTGYALHKAKHFKQYFSRKIIFLCWVLSLTVTSTVVFAVYHAHMGSVAASAYDALSRVTWSIAVAWMIFACTAGFGGKINTILSWKAWIPLSRLTYCAFLLHPIVIKTFFNSSPKPLFFQIDSMITVFFGIFLISYLCALLASLTFEYSTMALEKFILRRFSKK
ncbi:nose resistant to fluoxetine protein 6-like [Centruroides vittatus]|uniref:nose resistant to fluoxetine protein 6-like n=1 Tax=Centruroides vittatus TaxID=120091 RepID=UPI00350EF261